MSMTKEADSRKVVIECDFCGATETICDGEEGWRASVAIEAAETRLYKARWGRQVHPAATVRHLCTSCFKERAGGDKPTFELFELPVDYRIISKAVCRNEAINISAPSPPSRQTSMTENEKKMFEQMQADIKSLTEAAESSKALIAQAESRMNEAVQIMQAFVSNLNQREHRPFTPPSGPANPYPVTFGTPPTPQLWNGGPDPKPCCFGPSIQLPGECNLNHIDFDALRAAQKANEGIDASEMWAKDFLDRKATLAVAGGQQGGSSLRALWEDMAQHPENYPDMEICSPITEEEMRPADDDEGDDEDCIVDQFGNKAARLKEPEENAGTHVAQYMNPKIERDPNQLIEWETPVKSEDTNLRAETWAVPLDDVLPGLYVNKDKRRSQELVTVERDGRSYVIRETTGEVRSYVDQSQFEKRYKKVE